MSTILLSSAMALALAANVPDVKTLQQMNARFAPVDLTADVSKLPANERQALAKIIEAAELMDALFLRQVWAGNEAMLLELHR